MTGYAPSAGQPRTNSKRWINMKARGIELVETVTVKGLPKKEDFNALDVLASTITQKHKSISEAAA